ncbi:MAG: DNA polymerase I [Candidatus Omnitrophica bacterium CG12_big_fil_rev_8_21_14_0_65_43_15]|uniref:DNA polymerase I n=1 Tax=Candidatus Taenaricola geysiri TaxID=1974752 RepID=A0A2J0LEJ6_9BACT|nr:MAG: DNA polymerase I [Candidatus Omnitrophica bacterium CG1_02_43_210]PIV11924.1 MAG: DNA polymerase I [Candidatus Omnitrophica bacterium CG03_land_8_20_14_0_80_43_22]PIW66285.1 MAG: DNA polymerase I [Candidatus Omnitrophica bacterium CG12_big_fil_rev_8_21_14_0_65_43_15]PJC46970.1 MAG: DNA polymerase I [Candidatus Omnitrophica bacterium CG_4_9_14_0_2_um_filter_43_12]
MKKLFLIDGNSFCYRAFYAIANLSASNGQPTNAVYGFVVMLNKIIKDQKPDYIVASFDRKEPTFRHKKFDGYKIHRKPMPDELVSQLPIIKSVLEAYRVPVFELAGFEADDILATIVKKCRQRDDLEIYIATGDKDALALVDSRTFVYSPNNFNGDFIYDQQAVKEKFGVLPCQMVELMALMGDASDNIPGVPGIGPKTASSLITEFSSVENLLNNIDMVKRESTRELLKKNTELLNLSRELAQLDADVPIDFAVEDLKIKNPDQNKLYSLFKELEFKKLLKGLAPDTAVQEDVNYILVDTDEKFDKLLKSIAGLTEFALDFETTGTDPMQAVPVGVSFCYKPKEAYYVPVKKIDGIFKKLKPILENEKIGKVGQNIKYEILILKNQGIELKGVIFDTMVASYLLNPSKSNHNLEDIAFEYLDYRMNPVIEDLLGKGKSAITMDQVDVDKVCRYCCQDSDITMRLKNVLSVQLQEKGLYELFFNIELPLVYVLAQIEYAGVRIDTGYLAKMSTRLKKDLDNLTARIYEIAGGEFNINSPKQLSAILFDKLKLRVVKKTKTGVSTDESVLQVLAAEHALPDAILQYRQLFKLKSTYVDALPELVNKKTDRLHASFNQTVTATGRLSSSEPNLQNIPVKTDIGRQIRGAFISKGKQNRILSADYSQVELRILAHISGDSDMIEAFKSRRDIHTHTASLIYNVKEEDVDSKMRSSAKTVNFGIIYGMSPYGLSKDLRISVEEATIFIDAYFARYPKVKAYMQDSIEAARSKGFVTTLMDRRRWIPEINSLNVNIRQFAERTAINTPIQGSAADLIKIAMININSQLRKKNMKTSMILQVHDELVFDVPEEETKEATALIRDLMEHAIELKVPVEASLKIGENWLDMREIK